MIFGTNHLQDDFFKLRVYYVIYYVICYVISLKSGQKLLKTSKLLEFLIFLKFIFRVIDPGDYESAIDFLTLFHCYSMIIIF